MHNLHILAACSAVKNDAASNATWFQTFPPYGRYPVGGTIKGAAKNAEYIIDEAAAKAIIDNFNAAKARKDWPGILVDEEHFSLDPEKSSAAMAWAKDIRQEDDGSIWTRWEFTARGRELFEGHVLMNRSPAFEADKVGKDYRPCELRSIGMTNTPHFTELSTLAAARAAEVKNTQGEKMNKILAKLNLAEGASEDDVVAAIDALQKKASTAEATATEAQKKQEEAEGKCRAMECEQFLEAHKDQIKDVAACKEAFMKDPETTKKIFGACKEPEAPKPQKVLGAAKNTPAVDTGKTFASLREEMAALPACKRQEFYLAHKDDIDAGK